MKYGEKRDYKKIDIFRNGFYVCSTTWAKTCKEAIARFLQGRAYENAESITANFYQKSIKVTGTKRIFC